MKISTILRRARYKIRKPELWGGAHSPGWINVDGMNCSWSAIHESSPTEKGRCDALLWLSRAIGRRPVIGWNDSPSRTHSQVLRAFDKAIKLAEKEEAGK